MSGFSDREKDFENKFSYDEKLAFKIEARACKLFGLWVADKLGVSGDAAQKYALEVVDANLDIPGFEDVLQKVAADLKAKNVSVSDHTLQVQIDKFHEEARQQILKEGA